MKLIILAAGYATRLYPITLDKPKTLLDIGKKKILDLITEKIPSEITDLHLVTNAKFYPLFEEWRQSYNGNINLINDCTTSYENRLGAIRDMHLAVSKSKEDDALILASDNLFDFELDKVLALFKRGKRDIIVAYDIQDKNNACRFGVLSTDKNGKIVKFEEKPQQPETSLISTGIYFLTKESLRLMPHYIEENRNNDSPGNFIKWLAERNDVYAFVAKGKWYDIGNLDVYNEAVRYFDKKAV